MYTSSPKGSPMGAQRALQHQSLPLPAAATARRSPSSGARPRRPSTRVASVAEWSAAANHAVDVASTSPAILQSSHEVFSAALEQHATGHSITHFLDVLSNMLNDAAASSSSAGAQDAVASASGHAAAAAAVGAAVVADAATTAAVFSLDQLPPGVDPTALTLESLALWAGQHLQVVQTVDPIAFHNLRTSLNELLGAVRQVLDTEAATDAQHMTTALVLGLQQLASAVHLGSASGAVEAMAAAQDAVAANMATGMRATTLAGLMQFVFAVVALIVACVPRAPHKDWRTGAVVVPSDPNDPVPEVYDPKTLGDYFGRHPVLVMRRTALIASRLGAFGAKILVDWQTGKWEANMPTRAVEFRHIIEEMGPAFIKIAQILSTRVDMCPEPYLRELTKLQDSVPPFSTLLARDVLEEGLAGRRVDEVFEWLSEEPLACASLGQVYKGKLRPEQGGAEVAVKIQRPGALESVALDVFLMRRAAVIFSYLPGMNDQWASVLDEWSLRFFQEMDYKTEAANTLRFKKQMADLDGVCVANVFPQFTSRKVLVSEWVYGEKLSESKAEDVRALCATLLNCYLIQLLETGFLHADPHPGNLLRTPDGRICILDFGLVTEVTEEQRVTLVEYIAHLTMEDYQAVSEDLVRLGFVPDLASLPDNAIEMITPVMEQVMGAIVKGGGLGKSGLNFMSLTSDLEHVAKDYQVVIPPFFALILRAFSVIEGTALTVDPNYSIVSECLPYLSRRLLKDSNPRMRTALRKLLYGDSERIDLARLQKLIKAFTSFTTDAKSTATTAPIGPTLSSAASADAETRAARGATASSSSSSSLRGASLSSSASAAVSALMPFGLDDGAAGGGPLLNDAAKDVLKAVFSRDGNYAQELIAEEMVAAVDAMSREAVGEALRLVLSSSTAVAALRSVEALGPLRTMLLPLPLPLEMLSSFEPSVALSKEDRQTLRMLRTLLDVMSPSVERLPEMAATSRKALRVAGELVPILPDILPGVQFTLELFFRQLVRRMAVRLAEELEPGRLMANKAAAAAASRAAKSN